jgi:hypothetical protein
MGAEGVTGATLKLSRAVFGFLIVTVNAGMVYLGALLTILFPGNMLTIPTIIFLDAVGNAGIVLLTTEQSVAPGP